MCACVYPNETGCAPSACLVCWTLWCSQRASLKTRTHTHTPPPRLFIQHRLHQYAHHRDSLMVSGRSGNTLNSLSLPLFISLIWLLLLILFPYCTFELYFYFSNVKRLKMQLKQTWQILHLFSVSSSYACFFFFFVLCFNIFIFFICMS